MTKETKSIQALRIGNLAQDINGNLLMVDGIAGNNAFFKFADAAKGGIPKQPAPIILTADWFLKLGFVLDFADIYIKDGYRGFIPSDKELQKPNAIFCVHHLQNDYFDVTGQPLTI